MEKGSDLEIQHFKSTSAPPAFDVQVSVQNSSSKAYSAKSYQEPSPESSRYSELKCAWRNSNLEAIYHSSETTPLPLVGDCKTPFRRSLLLDIPDR